MSFTVSTIRSRLLRRLKDLNNVSNDLLFDWATDVNQGLYRTMFRADPERFISTQSYTVSTSPSTQALPATFRDTQENGCGFFYQNADGTAGNRQLAITGYGSPMPGYWISGTNVVFTGINSAQTVVLRHVPVLADIDDLADTFIVPDENKDLVTEGMVVQYYKWCEDPREVTAGQRFSALEGDFSDKLPKAPLVWGFIDNSSSF